MIFADKKKMEINPSHSVMKQNDFIEKQYSIYGEELFSEIIQYLFGQNVTQQRGRIDKIFILGRQANRYCEIYKR
jgi:hypothetical protein